eukprot:TRINITY_DN47520_c0_g1_i1.p1 TRINITY_DN47520_c0_g1~~TRINITY_DN47520_c0_g1_i1.p1  ORF type:complete len:405 (+),score=107.33 TRINITY_DN47520_c0_g1_i1:63-1217(+)
MPFALHPTQMELMGSEMLGLVVGNFAITIGFGVLCFTLVRIAAAGGEKVFPKLFEGLDTQGWMRFPSAPLFVFQVLYQGTSLGCINLIIQPPSAVAFVVGVVGLFVCITVPIATFLTIVSHVPSKAVYMRERGCKGFRKVFLGSGEWVNKREDCAWVQRWSSVMRTYRQETAWYMFVEFTSSMALSAIAATETDSWDGCGHKKVFTALVFVVMGVMEACVWPHARYRDSSADFVLYGLQASAMLLMGVGYYSKDQEHAGFSISSTLLVATLYILLVRVVIDVCSELYILISGRRNKLQEDLNARDCGFNPSMKVAASLEALSPMDSFPQTPTSTQYNRSYGRRSFFPIPRTESVVSTRSSWRSLTPFYTTLDDQLDGREWRYVI